MALSHTARVRTYKAVLHTRILDRNRMSNMLLVLISIYMLSPQITHDLVDATTIS